MFSNAVPIAAGFTRPVVISSRTAQGECAGTIGAYVVVNRAGWILTAGHLLDIVRAQQDSAQRYAGYRGNVVEFHRDIAADKRYRKKGVRTLHQPAGASVRNHSVCGGGWTACAWSRPGWCPRPTSRSGAWSRSIRTPSRITRYGRTLRGTSCRAGACASSASPRRGQDGRTGPPRRASSNWKC